MKLYEMLDRWKEITADILVEFEGIEDGQTATPMAAYVSDYTSDESLPFNSVSGPVVEYMLRMIHKWGVPEDLAFVLGRVECPEPEGTLCYCDDGPSKGHPFHNGETYGG